VQFAGHYGLRPDFCQAADLESEGIAGNLAGYAKATWWCHRRRLMT